MEQSRGQMSSEQLQALRSQVSNMQGSPMAPQNSPMTTQQSMQQSMPGQQSYGQMQQQSQPQPQTQQRPTAQQAMMARMQASRNQQGSPSVMQQGEQYQPINQQSANPPSSPVANQTIINTTQQPGGGGGNNGPGGPVNGQNNEGNQDGQESGKSKGFKMNPIMAVAIVIAVLLVGFFIVSYLSKSDGNAENPSESEVVDPFNDTNLEWIIPENQYEYTSDQIAQLRAAGYTGDEIEQHASTMTPFEDLIRQAEAARDAYIQDAIAPLYDTASDEYKHFISQTWLALEKRTDIYDWKITAMNYAKRENLDYEKVGVYGNQLYIKVYLDDFNHDDWFYCLVTPEEWNKLNDAGNVIVNYTYATRVVGDDPMTYYEDTENFYIISASIEFIE